MIVFSPWESLQQGEIRSGSAPFKILLKRLIMTRESPSTISLVKLCSIANCNPLVSPHNSAALFVVWPRLPALMRRMCP
jgi:hypothetical protein